MTELDIQGMARDRILRFVGMLPNMNIFQVPMEFHAIRNLLRYAPQACIPIVTYMTEVILHGGKAWNSTTSVARGLLENTPELHGLMRQQWRDPLLFHILTNNANADMREVARRLDLASAAPDQGSLGVARAMTLAPPRPLFIIGAGFSYDSMPLTQELEALVAGLLAGKEIPNPVRLLADDWREAWRLIAEDPHIFKQRFAGFSAARHPSIQHAVLAEALRAETVAGVVSFNWDNHIERSGDGFPVVNLGDQAIDRPGLWKMHGDVNAIEVGWVWPHETGRPLANVCKHVINHAHSGNTWWSLATQNEKSGWPKSLLFHCKKPVLTGFESDRPVKKALPITLLRRRASSWASWTASSALQPRV